MIGKILLSLLCLMTICNYQGVIKNLVPQEIVSDATGINDSILKTFSDNDQDEDLKYGKYDELYNSGHVSKDEMKWFDSDYKDINYEKKIRYTNLNAIKNNHALWRKIPDIGTPKHYRYTQEQRSLYRTYNLGNDGTPSINFYPKIKHDIGDTSGYIVFDLYKRDLFRDKMYHTQSPCTDVNVIFANGKGHIFNSKFAFSFNENFHFKITYDEKQLDREWGHKKSENDSQIFNGNVTFSGLYNSNNNKHIALLKLMRYRSSLNYTGGIIGDNNNNNGIVDYKDYYCTRLYDRKRNIINDKDNVLSDEMSHSLLFFYQYRINSLIQSYTECNINIEKHSFSLNGNTGDKIKIKEKETTMLYNDKTPEKDTYRYFTMTYDREERRHDFHPFVDNDIFLSTSIENGIKGNVNKKTFYRVYDRVNFDNRYFKYYFINSQKRCKHDPLFNHYHFCNIVGTHFRVHNTFLNCEFSMPDGTYNINIGYEHRLFKIEMNHIKYNVPLIFKGYDNVYHQFTYYLKLLDFEKPEETQLEIKGNFGSNKIKIKPFIFMSLTRNELFFLEKEHTDAAYINNPTIHCEAKQNGRYIGFLSCGTNIIWNIRKELFMDINFMFNKKTYVFPFDGTNDPNNERLDNIPSVICSCDFYWKREFDGGRAKLMIGTEISFRSAFIGDKYNPLIQQYYQQKDYELTIIPPTSRVHNLFEIKPRTYINPYASYEVGRLKFFVALFNLKHLFTNENPYASPFQPEPSFTYNFGINYTMFE